jgi:tRNA threonylcarbamoyl adenosine modification protein YeaZ
MKILTFDTSTEFMYVGLSDDEKIISERMVESTKERYNSALLIPTIVELLNQNQYSMKDIEAIGVNIGPGSFTGIRASATVARILGQHLNIPVVGISSLEVISRANISDRDSLCLLDARRDKAYMAIYSNTGEIKQPPCAVSYDNAVNMAREGQFFILADNKMFSLISEGSYAHVDHRLSNVTTMLAENLIQKSFFGKSLIKLTSYYLKGNNTKKWLWYDLKPLYIQPPAITSVKKV